jgi:predicted nucleic acid-binding protein
VGGVKNLSGGRMHGPFLAAAFCLLAARTAFADGVHIPPAVYQEVVVRGSGQPGSQAVANAGWITTRSVTDTLAVAGLATILDQGEAEAIVLAKELSAAELLIDERQGRRIAQALGLTVKGTLGILLRAKQRGLIPAVRDELDNLIRHGAWISGRVYKAVLQAAGEAQTP